jgi:hypothetical protein
MVGIDLMIPVLLLTADDDDDDVLDRGTVNPLVVLITKLVVRTSKINFDMIFFSLFFSKYYDFFDK